MNHESNVYSINNARMGYQPIQKIKINYILYDDSSKECQLFHYALKFFQTKNIDFFPSKIHQMNSPEYITSTPSIILPDFNNTIILGERDCFIFLAHHTRQRLGCNFVKLHKHASNFMTKIMNPNNGKEGTLPLPVPVHNVGPKVAFIKPNEMSLPPSAP